MLTRQINKERTHDHLRIAFKAATHKSLSELYSKYDFVLPHLYEVFFNKHIEELGTKFQYKDISDELKIILHDIEEKGDFNEKSFSKIINISERAIKAIKAQDKNELELVTIESIEMLNQIKELEKKAYYDDLTGLLNRSGLHKGLCKAGHTKHSGVLFFIDLDGFKNINDTYGHNIGDSALRAFAASLRKQLLNIPPEMKFISRVGGDEFIIAVLSDNAKYASTELFKLQSKSLKIAISEARHEPIGFSLGERNFSSKDEFDIVIMDADKLMYQNKKNRKNKITQVHN